MNHGQGHGKGESPAEESIDDFNTTIDGYNREVDRFNAELEESEEELSGLEELTVSEIVALKTAALELELGWKKTKEGFTTFILQMGILIFKMFVAFIAYNHLLTSVYPTVPKVTYGGIWVIILTTSLFFAPLKSKAKEVTYKDEMADIKHRFTVLITLLIAVLITIGSR